MSNALRRRVDKLGETVEKSLKHAKDAKGEIKRLDAAKGRAETEIS
jgi:hypothetical protein